MAQRTTACFVGAVAYVAIDEDAQCRIQTALLRGAACAMPQGAGDLALRYPCWHVSENGHTQPFVAVRRWTIF